MSRTNRNSIYDIHRDGQSDFKTIIRRDSRASTQRNHKVDRKIAKESLSTGNDDNIIQGKGRRITTKDSIYEF